MRNFTLLFIFILLFCQVGQTQVTFNLDETPRWYTPILDTVFLAGNFNSWQPNDPSYALTKGTNGNWTGTFNLSAGSQVEYKYTRGSWLFEETQLNGNFQANHTFTAQNGMTRTDTVWNWKDMLGWHTAVGNTFLLDLDFYIPQLSRNRRIWLYLPPDYFTSNNDYPVLYLHDGQNLFDEVYTSFGTEWEIDESMEALIAQGEQSAIVVGIDNGGGNRIDEYSPWVNPQYGGGQGDDYVNFIVNNLKPWLDANYRTQPGRDHTAILGSSLGGLISFYASLKHQNVFSKAGWFSPSFWFANEVYSFAGDQGHQAAMRIYLLAGGQESQTMVPNMLAMQDTLLANGFQSSELNAVVKSDGQHAEWFWAREFPDAYKWLFANITSVEEEVIEKELNLTFKPGSETLLLDWNGEKALAFQLIDLQGRQFFEGETKNGTVSLEGLDSGIWVLKVTRADGQIAWKKFWKP